MAQATAKAHANFALIKYWGKRDKALNLPAVGSLSITLDDLYTRTSVNFDSGLSQDSVSLNGQEQAPGDPRVSATLDLLREAAGISDRARVESENNFPTAAGLASSASGFAALVVAAAGALDLRPGNDKLSEWARRGSGSAARSIFGGYVEMAHGQAADGSDCIARPLLDGQAWPLNVVIAVTSSKSKKIGSTDGMGQTATTSPYYPAWVEGAEADLATARQAVENRDFQALAEVSEWSCLKMHASAIAANPGVMYWNGATLDGLHHVRNMRAQGVPVFFTVDAGPQIKAICLPEAVSTVRDELSRLPGVERVIVAGLGPDAHLVGEGESC